MTLVRRVLVVEDHERFRHALCDLLRELADVAIVGETADGPDAIAQAETLQPDVVTLDLGLPTMTGLDVARRLRVVAPNAKLLLVTNEFSLDVIEEAFRRGAHGYVYKPRVHQDLFRAFEGLAGGGQFLAGLERIARGDILASHRHDVLFYSSEAVFVSAFSRFIASALEREIAVIVVVTESHVKSLRRSLELSNVQIDRAIRDGLYIPVSISKMLSEVMVDNSPDPIRFSQLARSVLTEAAQRAGQHRNVVACGEGAPIVWAGGALDAAIQLEQLWDGVSRNHHVDLLCGYPMAARSESARAVRRLCAEHTSVEIR